MNQTLRALPAAAAAGLLAAACAQAPRLHHVALNASTPEDFLAAGHLTYELPATVVAIAPRARAAAGTDLEARTAPVPREPRQLYALVPDETLARVALGMEYLPGTRLPRELAVQTQDRRKAAINALGAIGVLGLRLAAPAAVAPAQILWPVVFNADDLLAGSGPGAHAAELACDASQHGRVVRVPCGTVQFAPVAADAVAHERFLERARDGTAAFPVAACRRADLALGGPLAPVRFSVLVSDARYVRFVRLPEKGRLSFHPVCGADVDPGGFTTADGWALAEQLAGELDAVRRERDKLRAP